MSALLGFGGMAKSCSIFVTLILVLLTAGVAPVSGQVPQGQILGTVTDESGAVIPKANVVLKNEATGAERSIESTASGEFSFPYLNSGIYTVTVTVAGFKTAVYPGIQVQVEERKRLDAKLSVGEIATEVVISDAAALLQTDSATLGTVVSRKEVIGMPLNGREFSQLAVLVPGVRSEGTTGGALITVFATAIAVGGTSSGKNSYNIDGVDNSFNVWNGPALNPSIDSIQEFRIDKSQFSAEFGRGGAEIHLVTKSGTKDFHGALWEYLRNGALNAGNYITHKQDTEKRNQFGANLGGPIFLPRFGEGGPAFFNGKDRAFFFFNWESQRDVSSIQPLGSVFTNRMRAGDLSEFAAPIKDPLTGQPFPGNIIPANRLNPVSLAYMEAMMGPSNLPGIVNNFIRPFTTSTNWDQYTGRIDYRVSEKDDIFFRFNVQPREGIAAPLSATSINHHEKFKFFNTGLGLTRTWTSRFITETRFGYHHENLLLESQAAERLPTKTITGFGSVQPPPERLPFVSIAPFYHVAQWGFPLGFLQDSFELVQNATWMKGKHQLKAGGAARRQSLHKTRNPEYMISLGFNGAYTGNGVADYLLGLPFTASEGLGFAPRLQKYGDYSAFVQDDWKITKNLTLNLGLRYELDSLPSEEHNLFGNFSPELRRIVLAGDRIITESVPDVFILNAYRNFLIPASQTNLPQKALGFPDRNNFAPRIGFAWRPFGDNKTVVRGGYGIFYLLDDGNISFNNTGTIPYGGGASVVNTTPVPTFNMNSPFSTGVAAPPPPTAAFRDPNMRTGYLQQATLGVQRELPWGMVAEVNVQDQNSKKLETSWNINQPAPGPGAVDTRRPFQEFSGSLGGTFHEGYSRYDALEVAVRKSSAHYTFQWSHTWAKKLGRVGVADPYNRDLFYGPLDYIPHQDKVNFVIDLPFGQSRKWLDQGGVVNAVLGGWQVTGIAILHQSGSPLTITWDGDPANVGLFNVSHPNRIADGRLDNPTPARWFDTSAFVAPTPGTWGNSGTGIIFGPSSRFFDAGVYKNFVLGEDVGLQFRTEFFNVFNHPNLANPFTVANEANFGSITTKNQSPRVIQFALRLTF